MIFRSPRTNLAIFYGVLQGALGIRATNFSSSTSVNYTDCDGTVLSIGNRYCDNINNNPECDYDGGDCCYCTCVDEEFPCGHESEYDCLDPSADCDVNACQGPINFIGDGDCDEPNYNPECDYDGGDCCPCTCVDGDYPCGRLGYNWKDPVAQCDVVGCEGHVEVIGDGECNSENNTSGCQYDGGDCCSCTCVADDHSCGIRGYDCQDPTADCRSYSIGGSVYPVLHAWLHAAVAPIGRPCVSVKPPPYAQAQHDFHHARIITSDWIPFGFRRTEGSTEGK